jgi:hypothetical protein
MRCALCIDKQCIQVKDCTNIADNITYKGKDHK